MPISIYKRRMFTLPAPDNSFSTDDLYQIVLGYSLRPSIGQTVVFDSGIDFSTDTTTEISEVLNFNIGMEFLFEESIVLYELDLLFESEIDTSVVRGRDVVPDKVFKIVNKEGEPSGFILSAKKTLFTPIVDYTDSTYEKTLMERSTFVPVENVNVFVPEKEEGCFAAPPKKNIFDGY